MKTSSTLFILNYNPLFTARCKNVKVVVRIGLRDTAEMLARCLSNSALAGVVRS